MSLDLSSCPRAKRAVDGPAVRIGQHEKGCPILSRCLRKGWEPQTLGCHPAPERSAQWMDLQFASVSTKKGAPSFRVVCERVGTTTLGCHPVPERTKWKDLLFRLYCRCR